MHQSPRSKDEAEMPAPSIPHRASFAMSTGSYGPDGDQTPGKTPLMQFINGHMGLTPASTSSDEEGPQKLYVDLCGMCDGADIADSTNG